MAANYALFIVENGTFIGGYQHVSSILYIFQTAMALEVRIISVRFVK